ncbi:hypothetical protein ACFLYO_02605 [Chloroflexota bacterium]
MNDWTRFLSTAVVWVIYGLMVVGMMAMTMSPALDEEGMIAGVVFIVTIFAAYATRAIWRFPQQEGASVGRSEAGRSAGKNKRGERVARLVDDLSEDEIIELETLLLSRDDEDYRAG